MTNNQNTSSSWDRRGTAEIIGVFVATLLLLSLFVHRGLLPFDNDCLYADVARTMLRSGDWLNPSIHGVPFLDKPPLFYWLVALAMGIFGEYSPFAARIVAVLGGAGCATTMFAVVRRPWGLGQSLPAALVAPLWFVATALLVEYSRRCYMEVPVALSVLGSIALLHRGAFAVKDRPADPRLLVAGGAVAGIGFMFKSLVGLFGLIPFVLFVLFKRRFDLLKSPWSWGSIAAFVAVTVPWHAYQLVARTDVFIDFTWRLHVEDQILEAQPWSTGPVWFYGEAMIFDVPLLGMAVIILLVGAVVLWHREQLTDWDWHLLLAVVVMLAVFSASETKKVLYLIAVAPVAMTAAAGLIGRLFDRRIVIAFAIGLAGAGAVRTGAIYTPDGPYLRGQPELVEIAEEIREKTPPEATINALDTYFSILQFYGERRTVSYWRQRELVQQTQRIPYIKAGQNMRWTEGGPVATLMRQPGFWVVRRDALPLLGQGVLRHQVAATESYLLLAIPDRSAGP